LTFVVIGGRLVGVAVFGELTAFMDEVVRYYPRIRRDEIRLHLLEAGVRIMPEISEELSEYCARVLSRRAGVSIPTNSPVERIIVRLGLGPFPTVVESAKIQLNFLHCGVSVRDEGQANLIHWEQDLKGLTCSEDISRPKGAAAARVGTP
jgi:hypothetical protein